MCVCRCQSICDLSFQLEKELECRNSEVSKLQQVVSDLQVYVQEEREQVLRLYTENDRLQVYFLFHICTVHLDIIKVFIYSPTDTLVSCLKKNNIKIYIKTAPTWFGVVTPSSGSAIIHAYKSYCC